MSTPVRVLIFEDLQCPDCAAFHPVLEQRLRPKYGGAVAFERYDFPLPKHAWARQAAIAARFFGWRSPDLESAWRAFCLSNLRSIDSGNFPEKLSLFADEHAVDVELASAALNDPFFAAVVDEQVSQGRSLGVARTPTVIVGQKRFVESFSVEDLIAAIDGLLLNHPGLF